MRFYYRILVLLITFNLQAQFLRKKKTIKYENIIISDSATQRLSKAIQFETVAKSDSLSFYSKEFQNFKAFLKESYPLVLVLALRSN